MKKFRAFLTTMLVTSAVVSSATVAKAQTMQAVFSLENNSLTVDGVETAMDVAPIVEDGRVLVPIRAIVESLIGYAEWDAEEKSVYISTPDADVTMRVDDPVAIVNGEEVSLEVPPTIVDERVLVPLRFVSENMGMEASWNEDTKEIIVSAVVGDDEAFTYSANTESGNVITITEKGAQVCDSKGNVIGEYANTPISEFVYENKQGKKAIIISNNGYEVEYDGKRYPLTIDEDGSGTFEGGTVSSIYSNNMVVNGSDRYTSTGEIRVFFKGEEGDLTLVTGYNGTADDCVIYPDGTEEKTQREYYALFTGSDGKLYAFKNMWLIIMDSDMKVLKEIKFTDNYEVYGEDYKLISTDDGGYALISPDGSQVEFTFDKSDDKYSNNGEGELEVSLYYYKGSDGNQYLTKYDAKNDEYSISVIKNGKEEKIGNYNGSYLEYTSDDGVYTGITVPNKDEVIVYPDGSEVVITLNEG